MKSCVMAGWLMTVSVGNAIVVILAEARLTDNMVSVLCGAPVHTKSDTKIRTVLNLHILKHPLN